MKKVLFMSAIAAAALASCTSNEYAGQDGQTLTESINFGTSAQKTTRANSTGAEAAKKLNNNFIVYGFKTNDAENDDKPVFQLYNVNYTEGTANTTESNTAGWEYVGLANHTGSIQNQTIKYWDYAEEKYVFSAVSGVGIDATKITSAASVYDKGWTVNIPAGGDLSTLYASDRKPVEKANYQQQVDLTFRALATKIRFAMYETIPGYSVHIDNLYYDNLTTPNNTNFAIDGKFKNVKSSASTPLTITYYDDASGIENRPKVSYEESAVESATYGIFGANLQATPALGTTSPEATYDQSDKSYTMILPYESLTETNDANKPNVLKLKVDYTLTSTDGSGEKIHVSGATANVPTEYSQWKPNFAYTYLFKISDNTNGTTGTGGDPTGLYPITFDAVVVTEDTDVQETITTVAEPSITTYAKGIIVTENNEYIDPEDVYVTVMEAGALKTLTTSTAAVYEVNNFGDIEKLTTEEVVENYLNNFCVLTPVGIDLAVTEVPLINGTKLAFTAGQVLRFDAQTGKTYAFVYTDALHVKHYKVIRVKGEETTPTWALTPSTSTINKVTGAGSYAVLALTKNATAVHGAVPNFVVKKSGVESHNLTIVPGTTDGTYVVTATPAAIAAGTANGDYSVTFNDETVNITVSIGYVLRNEADDANVTAVTITAGNSTGVTVKNKIADALADGDVTEVPAGITVEKTATGTYKITADADKAYGPYEIKIAGQTLTVNVDSYAFASDLVITKALSGTDTGVLTLKKNGAATGVAVAYSELGGNDVIATGADATDGEFTLTAVAGGSFDVTYENAKAKVTVNAYTITAAATSIDAPTGSTTLTVKRNGEAINAVAGKVIVTAHIAGVDCIPTKGSQYTLTTTGSKLVFKPSVAGTFFFTYCEDGKQVAVTSVVAN